MKPFEQHERIALQFSGGKDSLATLFLLRDHWDKFTVYHLDSGDQLPETKEIVRDVLARVPRFKIIRGQRSEIWPSDLVGAGNTPFGAMLGHNEPPLISRYECCWQTIMAPMRDAMIADDISLIIRGQKAFDALGSPIRSGAIIDEIEYWNPIENWTDEQVFDYLREEGIAVPRYYREGMPNGPDCAHCTAWLEHKLPQYVEKFHPQVSTELQRRFRIISLSLLPQIEALTEVAK